MMNDKSKVLAYLGCFLISFYFRILIISLTVGSCFNIDLGIYRDAGQLVASRVNPYDYNDQVDLRKQLRTDEYHYNDWVSQSQEMWDYYASSNLPLATLFFGAVEYFFASAMAFRYFFAFFDSLLAVFILAFIINKWRSPFPGAIFFNKLPQIFKKLFPLFLGLALGAVSPILIYWGVIMPEHKGMGLLLMLSALYFSDNPNKILSLFVSPVLLGCSVSFIGLGVFIAPLCIYNIYQTHSNSNLKTIFYCLASFLACVIWLAPFMPELLTMMSLRLTRVSGTGHGSMWVIFCKYFPGSWVLIKNIFSIFFAGLITIGFFKKRLNVAMISAAILYLFTNIYLTNGGLDRMNIALVMLILLLGYSNFFYAATGFTLLSFVHGSFMLIFIGMKQEFDGYFLIIFTVLYTLFLVIQIFKKNQDYGSMLPGFNKPESQINP